jgi:ribosome biogenesis GTPase / thiamine phosphate phosphatase
MRHGPSAVPLRARAATVLLVLSGFIMSLHSLGWSERLQHELERARNERPESMLSPARVLVEHRGAFQVERDDGPCWAELTGKLRHEATDKLALPTVGDWVLLGAAGRIEVVLPRTSAFVRKAAGPRSEPQLVAANIDHVFVVTSANADYNPRRIERYLAAIAASGAAPVLVVNKADLCTDPGALLESLGSLAAGLPVANVSALERRGREQLEPYLRQGSTVALVGSSGVGKSTLVNWLIETEALATGPIREHDARGRHTTTRRELIAVSGGAALIDTPGMRELALWADDAELPGAFADIEALATQCRFLDCQHSGQPGCAIEAALERGELDAERLAHYDKLERELAWQRNRGGVASRQAGKQMGRSRARALRQRKRDPNGSKLED